MDRRAELPPNAAAVPSLDPGSSHTAEIDLGQRGNHTVVRIRTWTTHLPADSEGYEQGVLAAYAVEVVRNPNETRVTWETDDVGDAGLELSIEVEWNTDSGGVTGLSLEGSVMADEPERFHPLH